jgi:GntR family transcriptional regulator, transcriptional repressor for pyruvate dehydrogenase complex
MNGNIKKVERSVLCEVIVDNIKEMIATRQLSPGEKLPNESELAALMDVGRSSIREAIKILASMNIVQIIHGKGTFVCMEFGMAKDPLGFYFLDSQLLLTSIYEARKIIEPYSAKYAAVRRDETHLENMRFILKHFQDAIISNNSYIDYEIQFHNEIARASKNYIFTKMIPIINEGLYEGYKVILHSGKSHESSQRALENHSLIYELIKNKDEEGAFNAMYQHIRQSEEFAK